MSLLKTALTLALTPLPNLTFHLTPSLCRRLLLNTSRRPALANRSLRTFHAHSPSPEPPNLTGIQAILADPASHACLNYEKGRHCPDLTTPL